MYSSIAKKKCKCNNPECNLWPDLSFEGYSRFHAPQDVLDRLEQKKKRKGAVKKVVTKLRNESFANGDFEDASVQALKNDLDFVVSRYIRMLYSDEGGLCQCYTCPTIKHYSLMQCGHFVPRANMQTRFLIKNLRPQCPNCNEGKYGNLEVFAERLEKEEKGIVEYLDTVAREVYKYTREELKQLLLDMRAKLRIVNSKFKN